MCTTMTLSYYLILIIVCINLLCAGAPAAATVPFMKGQQTDETGASSKALRVQKLQKNIDPAANKGMEIDIDQTPVPSPQRKVQGRLPQNLGLANNNLMEIDVGNPSSASSMALPPQKSAPGKVGLLNSGMEIDFDQTLKL